MRVKDIVENLIKRLDKIVLYGSPNVGYSLVLSDTKITDAHELLDLYPDVSILKYKRGIWVQPSANYFSLGSDQVTRRRFVNGIANSILSQND